MNPVNDRIICRQKRTFMKDTGTIAGTALPATEGFGFLFS